MVVLEATPLLNLVMRIFNLELSLRGAHPEARAGELQTLSNPMAEECEKLRLKVAADAVRNFHQCRTTRDLERTLEFVRVAIAIELRNQEFFEPEPGYAPYFANPKLFGDEVFDAFPSANADIAEAGTCLALERSTACVMHAMRAAEAGLRALAKAVGVAELQNDWGGYLREVEEEVTRRAKAAGRRTADEEFFAEAATQLDHVRRAWRNPSMHIDRSYSQQRAEEILLVTKSLMRHLATRISERR